MNFILTLATLILNPRLWWLLAHFTHNKVQRKKRKPFPQAWNGNSSLRSASNCFTRVVTGTGRECSSVMDSARIQYRNTIGLVLLTAATSAAQDPHFIWSSPLPWTHNPFHQMVQTPCETNPSLVVFWMSSSSSFLPTMVAPVGLLVRIWWSYSIPGLGAMVFTDTAKYWHRV